jgi:hypothetical protein
VLTYGLSGEYAAEPSESRGPDADRSVYSRYYVRSLLNLDEEALKNAWTKAVSSTKSPYGGEKDTRLEYLSWRIWYLKRRHAEVEVSSDCDDSRDDDALDSSDEEDCPADPPIQGEKVEPVVAHTRALTIKTKVEKHSGISARDIDVMVEEFIRSPDSDNCSPKYANSSESKRSTVHCHD